MDQYRLYCLGDGGRFTKAEEITASDDADAIAQARAMQKPVICELWSRERKVAVLEPSAA